MTQPTQLCGTTDVKRHIDYTGRWTATTVKNMIIDVDNEIYDDYNYPINRTDSYIDSQYNRYYVGTRKIYRIDRVDFGTTTKTTLIEDIDYTVSTTGGYVDLNLSSGTVGTLSGNEEIEISWVPKLFSRLSALKTAQSLLEQTDVTSGSDASKELNTINKKIDILERKIAGKYMGPLLTSDVKYYDDNYFTNTRRFTQDHDRNKYL